MTKLFHCRSSPQLDTSGFQLSVDEIRERKVELERQLAELQRRRTQDDVYLESTFESFANQFWPSFDTNLASKFDMAQVRMCPCEN